MIYNFAEHPGGGSVEDTYRQYYNTLRILESKAWLTPIFHGELAAYKKNYYEEIGGFPTDIGADDSHTANNDSPERPPSNNTRNTKMHRTSTQRKIPQMEDPESPTPNTALR